MNEKFQGKELHVRLKSNDPLNFYGHSIVARGICRSHDITSDLKVEKLRIAQYKPGFKLQRKLKVVTEDVNDVVVLVKERNRNIAPDDFRYISWLANQKGCFPLVYVVPESGVEFGYKRNLLNEEGKAKLSGHSFIVRQLIKLKSVPAKISKDAVLAAIPRTLIPFALTIFLYYLRQNEVKFSRFVAYVCVSISITIGFSLIIQTILNWMTYWSEFTIELLEPMNKRFELWLNKNSSADESSILREIEKTILNVSRFISARGDVLLAGPLLGIFTSTIFRLALGAVGETASVFTLWGIFLLFANIIVGSVASGPYIQLLAHLRARGVITDRASVYFGIFDTFRMEFGRVADFGYQTIYNVVQAFMGVFFWLLLLIADAFFKNKGGYIYPKTASEEENLNEIFLKFQKQYAESVNSSPSLTESVTPSTVAT